MTQSIAYATRWMDDASCAGIPDFTEATLAEQRPICLRCPVIGDCRPWGAQDPAAVDRRAVAYAGLSGRDLSLLARAANGGRKPRSIECVYCGTAFESLSARALYCSQACRSATRYRRVKVSA